MKTSTLTRHARPLVLLALASLLNVRAAESPPPHPVATTAKADHVMRNGLVIIEAESGAGKWERVTDQGTTAIRSAVGAKMSYQVQFPEAGIYYVHLRCHYSVGMKNAAGEVLKGESTNDALFTVGGARLYGSDNATRPEGLRCHSADFRWWSRPKGPGAHTPNPIKELPAHTFIPQPGVYEVVIGYRSPGFVIDQLAFSRTAQPNLDSGSKAKPAQ